MYVLFACGISMQIPFYHFVRLVLLFQFATLVLFAHVVWTSVESLVARILATATIFIVGVIGYHIPIDDSQGDGRTTQEDGERTH